MNIYICSKEIVGKKFLDFFIKTDTISLMSRLVTFLRSSEKIDSGEGKGFINYEKNKASLHFTIFGKEKREFLDEITSFCSEKKVFLFNVADKSELMQKESVFRIRNKKTMEYIDNLKDEYDTHRANWDIPKMAHCIRSAEAIVAGDMKIR